MHKKVGRFILVFLVDLVFFVSLVRLKIRQKLNVPVYAEAEAVRGSSKQGSHF